MDIVMATSRGRDIEYHFGGRPAVQIHVHPGKSLAYLTHQALHHINKLKYSTKYTGGDIHVYYMAGLCDITYKDQLPHHTDWDAHITPHYEEVIFMDHPEDASLKLKHN